MKWSILVISYVTFKLKTLQDNNRAFKYKLN